MKATAIFFVVALLITLHGCGDETITPAPHTITTIDTIQDLYRLDTVLRSIGFLYLKNVVIQTDSEHQALNQEAIDSKDMIAGKSFPSVDFSTRTVIGIGDRGFNLGDTTGGITQSKFLCIRNDSTQSYICISRFIYPDIRPRILGDFRYVTHLYSIPKLLSGYSVVFVRDTI